MAGSHHVPYLYLSFKLCICRESAVHRLLLLGSEPGLLGPRTHFPIHITPYREAGEHYSRRRNFWPRLRIC